MDPFGSLRNQRTDDIGYFKASGEWVALHRPTVASFVTHTGSEGGLAWTAKTASGIDHGGLAGLTDDDHTQYLKEEASGGLASEVPDHTHADASQAGTVAHSALTGVTANQHHNQAHGASDHTDRTRTIDLHDFVIAVGTPDIAVRGANSRYAAWAFDGTGVFDEAITTQTIRIPQDFSSSLLVVLHWTNLGAGSGNVDWTVVAKVVNDTGDLNTTSGETLTSDTIAAPAQNIHKISVHSISLSPAAGDHLRLNVARLALTNTATDTLGNDVGLLKVQLVYTADS